MLNFEFFNPTKIVFGKDEIKKLDTNIPKDSKVMILYGGGSVKRFGTFDKVVDVLGDREIVEFGGIEPNPKYETLMRAAEMVKKEKVDFLLAVGGGSVMDGTKFVNLAAHYEGEDHTALLTDPMAVASVTAGLPIGTVVTLPATGSEMNMGGVISYDKGKYPVFSPLSFPKFSILDPTLTFTLPQTQIANGIIDTFVHTTEQYVTYPADSMFQDRTAEGILQTLVEVGRQNIDEPENYEARANFVWCATMALNGLIGAGVPQDWSAHWIGHEITALYGIDHGKTLAIVQPAIWRIRKEKKFQKLLQYAERVWGLTEGDEESRVDLAIEKTEEFFRSLGIKTRLSEYDLQDSCIEEIVQNLKNHGYDNMSETGDMTLDITREILKSAY